VQEEEMKKSKTARAPVSDDPVKRHRRANALDLAHSLEAFAGSLGSEVMVGHSQELLPDAVLRAEMLGLKRVSIADACHMSLATISRWANGTVRPHKMMARASLEEIAKLALVEAAEQRRIANGLREKLRA
jgi:hypothetical protein